METILKKNLLNNLTMSFNKIKAFRTLSFHLFWKKVSSNRSKSSWMLNQAYLKIWEQEELWILGAKSIGLSQKKEVRKITLIIVLTVYQDHLRKKILEYKKKMIVNPLFKMAIVIVNHLKKLNTLILIKMHKFKNYRCEAKIWSLWTFYPNLWDLIQTFLISISEKILWLIKRCKSLQKMYKTIQILEKLI